MLIRREEGDNRVRADLMERDAKVVRHRQELAFLTWCQFDDDAGWLSHRVNEKLSAPD